MAFDIAVISGSVEEHTVLGHADLFLLIDGIVKKM